MKVAISILLLLSSLYTCFAQQQNITKQVSDIFSFTPEGEWKKGKHAAFFMMIDSTQTYKNKHPVQCKQCCIGGVYFMLQGTIYNRLPLPVINEDSIEVSLTCKSQELKRGFLAINGIDEKEEVLYSDTLFFNNCKEWKTFRKNVSLCRVVLLGLTIGIRGNDTIFTAKKNERRKKNIQNLWLDRIEMKVNGKNITDYTTYPFFAEPPLHKEDIMMWSDSLPHSLRDKDIVAFGETVHGSENINCTIIRLFMNEIKYGGRKLILLELPLSKMLYVNRFVQGDSAFQIDKISSIIEFSLFSDAWIDFFRWLKEYNSTTKEKVWILGTDFDVSAYLETELDLCEYLLTINRSLQNSQLRKFAQLILKSKEIHQESIAFFQSQNYFEKELGKQEAQLIQTCLQLIEKVKYEQLSRDSLMFEQIQVMMELFSSHRPVKSMIYSHLMHVKYTSNNADQSIISSPFGALCKQHYSDRFFTVGIFTDRGKTLNYHYLKKMEYCLLNQSKPGSLEYWLNQVPLDSFYVPHSLLPTKLLFSRSVGIAPNEMTEWINPSYQMDGILFIKESIPLQKKSLNVSKDNNTFISRYKKCWDELKNE